MHAVKSNLAWTYLTQIWVCPFPLNNSQPTRGHFEIPIQPLFNFTVRYQKWCDTDIRTPVTSTRQGAETQVLWWTAVVLWWCHLATVMRSFKQRYPPGYPCRVPMGVGSKPPEAAKKENLAEARWPNAENGKCICERSLWLIMCWEDCDWWWNV